MNRRTFLISMVLLALLLSTQNGIGVSAGVSPGSSGLQVTVANDQEIVIEWNSPPYQVQNRGMDEKGGDALLLPGADLTDEIGQPRLPYYTHLFAIPPDAQPSLIIEEDNSEQIIQPMALVNQSSSVIKGLDADALSRETLGDPGGTANSLTGSGSMLFPNQPVTLSDDAWLRDQRLIRLELYPFQWQGVDDKITWHRYLKVRVQFNLSTTHPTLANTVRKWDDSAFESVFKAGISNYQVGREMRGLSPANMLGLSDHSQTMTSAAVKYRISINQDGLYRVSYETLQQLGFPVDTLDPRNFHLGCQGRDIAIDIEDHDQKISEFSPGEALIFYGQKFSGQYLAQLYAAENTLWYTYTQQLPDGSYQLWKPKFSSVMLEKYTDDNIYWLSYETAPGLLMPVIPDQNTSAPTPPNYLTTVHAEQSHFWKTTHFTSEDTWFWDEIQTSTVATRTYTTTLSFPVPEGVLATLRGEVVAKFTNDLASPDHHIQLYINRLSGHDPKNLLPIFEGVWDGKSRYRFTVPVSQSLLLDGVNALDVVVIKTPNLANEDIYFDWYEIEYYRQFQAMDDQINFVSAQSGTWQYIISGISTNPVQVYQISDPLQPRRVDGVTNLAGSIQFTMTDLAGDPYWVGLARDLPAPSLVEYIPSNLDQEADELLITHPDFIAAAQVLADYRTARGIATRVINVYDLYNEYNFGIFHPIAIKNYLKHTFATWQKPPSYVLLIGDGHWNFKGYTGYDHPPIFMPPNLAWVDPWQGEVDSANTLATVVGIDPLPDVYIARLPVNSSEQLSMIVNRIKTYENSTIGSAHGIAQMDAWNHHFLFIADNPDAAGNFPVLSDNIIRDYIPVDITPERVYLGPYTPSAATQAIINYLNLTGAAVVNFTGHAYVPGWTNEQIFTTANIPQLNNLTHLPVILSMTCLDGYWIYPNLTNTISTGPGLIEELLRAPNGGAIAAFSPTGLGLSTGHDTLQRGFYDGMFKYGLRSIGQLSLIAKLHLFTTGGNFDLLHTFTVFGDPALTISLPWRVFLPFVMHP